MEQEPLILPEHLSSPPVFSAVRVTRSLVFYVQKYMFCRSFFVLLYLFLLAIVLSVLLRYTDSDYPFGIFKLFSQYNGKCEMTKRQINGTQHTAISLRGIFYYLFISDIDLGDSINKKEVRISLTGFHWRSN